MCRSRIRVAQIELMQNPPGQFRCDVVADFGERAQRGIDSRRLLDESAHHHGGRVLGTDRGRRVEPSRRHDHRGGYQRHVDVGEGDVVGQRLGGDHVGERVQRRLAGQIRAVLGVASLHPGAGNVDDVPETSFAPVWQQRQHHPDRAEIVDGHHPFVVVQAVGGVDHRAANRPAGVVDQVVDMSEAAQDVFDGVFDGGGVGDVAGESVGLAAARADLGDQLVERVGVAGQREYASAPLRDRERRSSPDAAGCPGDDDVPAHQRAPRIVAEGTVGVKVLGPIAPQLGGVAGEVGQSHTAAAQRFLCFVADEGGLEVQDVEDFGGNPQLGGRHVAQHLRAAPCLEHRGDHRAGECPPRRGQSGLLGHCLVDAAQSHRLWCGQMEGPPVRECHVVLVDQGDERIHHVVDRDDVGASGVGQQDRGQ